MNQDVTMLYTRKFNRTRIKSPLGKAQVIRIRENGTPNVVTIEKALT
jgi:hypothetical protein